MMLPMMLPCCDFMMARQRALEASVSIARVKMFPEARCRRLPLRTAIANVAGGKPTVPARMWRIKGGSRMLPRPFSIDRFNQEGSLQRRCANNHYIRVWRKLSLLIHIYNFPSLGKRNEGAIGGRPRGNPIPLALRNMRLRSLANVK